MALWQSNLAVVNSPNSIIMEEIKDQNTNPMTSLSTSSVPIFHFTHIESDDEMMIAYDKVKRCFVHNANYKYISLYLKHPKRNKFLDQVNLSWLHQVITHLELHINAEVFQDLLSNKISDAEALSRKLLKAYNLDQDVNSNLFLEKVLANKKVDTKERLIIACHLIKVVTDKSLLDDFDIYFQEALNCSARAEMIESYACANLKIDIQKSTHELWQEWSKKEVDYLGNIHLPENFVLITKANQLPTYIHREFLGSKDFNPFKSLMIRSYFIIKRMNEEDIYFIIEPLQNSIWFTIQSILNQKERPIEMEIQALGKSLCSDVNQQFFLNNYRNPNNLMINNANLEDLPF